MIKICITGASGFVGKNLCAYLNKSVFEPQPVDLRKGLPHGLLYGADAVVHLAGKAHDLKNVSAPEEYYTVNFELTKKLFDAFISSDADKFIFISSVKAVRDTVEGVLFEEDSPEPGTVYGKSKLMAENYLLANVPAGKKVFILRPSMIHGPGNKGNLNLLYKVVKAGMPYPLAAFDNKRSFLSVQNLCFVISEMLQRNDIAQGVYNIADSEPLATNSVIRIMAEVLAKKTWLWRVNKKLVRFMAKAGDFLHMPLNSERLKKLTENYVVSNQKLVSALHKELPFGSVEGLRNTIQSFSDDK